MLGQVKNIDFVVCKLLTQVVHVTLDTLLVKARSLLTTARFETESGNENFAGGSSYLRTHLTGSLCARPTAQSQQLSTRPSLQCKC